MDEKHSLFFFLSFFNELVWPKRGNRNIHIKYLHISKVLYSFIILCGMMDYSVSREPTMIRKTLL